MLQGIDSLIAALTGVGAHHALFINGEWHLYGSEILLSYIILFTLTGTILSISRALPLIAIHIVTLFTSISVYRLLFHRTRHIRGPRLASVSKLWHVWQSRNSTNFRVQERLHEQYGEVVRTGPNEVTIFRPDAAELLDGYKNTNTRDVWYDILHPRRALVFARGKEEMRVLRRSWSQAVATRCLNEYAPRIVALAEKMVQCIREQGPSEPILLNDLMSWFSFDAMGEITFGRDFGMLSRQSSKSELLHQRQALALLAPVNDATWLAHLGFRLFPWLRTVKGWWSAVAFCEATMKQRMAVSWAHLTCHLQRTDSKQTDTKKVDMSSFFIEEFNDITKGPTSYRQNVLMGNSISAIVAGSDTTRAALVATWYFLLRYQQHIPLIRAELAGIDIDNNYHALSSLSHFNAVLKEVLRLAPPAMTGSSRITGDQGLWVGDTWIPGRTKVTSPKFVVHRRKPYPDVHSQIVLTRLVVSSAFVHPDKFIPERWTTRPELVLDARAYSPFSVGPHQCIGKSISQLESRIVTAKLILAFDMRFSSVVGQEPEAFWRDMKDQVTMMPGELWCCFDKRKR